MNLFIIRLFITPDGERWKKLKTGLYLFAVFALLDLAGFSDTFVLKNGKTVQGQIEEEREDIVLINTGQSVITISRDMISTVVKSLSLEVLGQQIREVLEKGRGMLLKGDREGAKRFYEMEILDLERTLAAYNTLPEEVLEYKKQLHKARRETLQPDRENQKVEDLYQKAVDALDRVHYEEALQLLKQAAAQDPKRVDIQFKLGMVACQLNRLDEAISALQRVLELDPLNHFKDLSILLPDLLDRRGRQLLTEKKPVQALKYYQSYMLLYSGDHGKPVDLPTFQARRKEREKRSEAEGLMEIFLFADEKERNDLSLAAVLRLEEIKPTDEDVRKLAEETRFLSEYLKTLGEGNLEKASRLKKDRPERLLQSERVLRNVKRATERFSPEMKTRYLFLEAESAFLQGKYGTSLGYLQNLIRDFPDHPLAKRASDGLKGVEFEVPVEKSLGKFRVFVLEGKFDEAEKEIREISKIADVEKSLQWAEVQTRSQSLIKERKADEIWRQVRKKLAARDYESGLQGLESLSRDYVGTYRGKKAQEWLKENLQRIQLRIGEQRFVDTGIFSILETPLREKKVMPATGGDREKFDDVMRQDSKARGNVRSFWLYGIVPICVGAVFLVIIFVKTIGFGKGRLDPPVSLEEREARFVQKGEAQVFDDDHCRCCGLRLKKGSEFCSHCNGTVMITEAEEIRKNFQNYYSLKGAGDNRETKKREKDAGDLLQASREMEEKGDTRDAIKMCLRAHQEAPYLAEPLVFLGELYEKARKPDKAYASFHKILMIAPANEQNPGKIQTLKASLNPIPVKSFRLILILSFVFWWLVFWVAISLDPWMWAMGLRAGLSFLGLVLTALLWFWQQRKRFKTVSERLQQPLVLYYPLPEKHLGFGELNRHADTISKNISDHTLVNVLPLTIWRLIATLIFCFAFLVSLGILAWINQTPWVFLAWFACVFLLVYVMEIHPRVFAAHVLLRHFQEELIAPWADPEMPFKPRESSQNVEGEFLIGSLEDLPIGWARNPLPYDRSLQGVLNSLAQTLNRHARFHNFYKNLSLNRNFKMAMPVGFFRLAALTALVCLFTMGMSLFVLFDRTNQERNYHFNLEQGYQKINSGDPEGASEYLQEAMKIDDRGFAPHFFLAQAYRTKGLVRLAEKRLKAAGRRGEESAIVHQTYAYFLQNQGRLKEALLEYKKSLDSDPDNETVLNNLGAASFKLGDFRNAVHYLKKVVEVNPQNGAAHITLGLSYEELGDQENARKAFQETLRIAQDMPYSQVAKNHLEQGETLQIVLPE